MACSHLVDISVECFQKVWPNKPWFCSRGRHTRRGDWTSCDGQSLWQCFDWLFLQHVTRAANQNTAKSVMPIVLDCFLTPDMASKIDARHDIGLTRIGTTRCHAFRLAFDAISGVKKLTKFMPVITYTTSACNPLTNHESCLVWFRQLEKLHQLPIKLNLNWSIWVNRLTFCCFMRRKLGLISNR